MKKIFFFLLLVNIITAASYFNAVPGSDLSVNVPLVHPEKIVLLSPRIPCLKWSNLVGPVAQQAKVEISGWDLEQSRVAGIPEGKVSVHWVHIPPLPTARRTTNQIEQLEKLGIPHWHTQEKASDPWHNAISLAVLSNGSDAMALVEDLKDKGVERAVDSEQTLEQFEFVIRDPTEQIIEKVRRLVRQLSGTQMKISECNRI